VKGLVTEGNQVLCAGNVSPPHLPVINDLVDSVPWIIIRDDRERRRGVATWKTLIVVSVVGSEL
jgi:hypothetical protein